MSILAEKSLDRPIINKYETLFHRHPSNPILTGKDWPYSMNSVFNAGATLLPDGSTLLLCRVAVLECLWHSRKIFAYSRNLVSSCRRTTKTRPFCPEGLTAIGL